MHKPKMPYQFRSDRDVLRLSCISLFVLLAYSFAPHVSIAATEQTNGVIGSSEDSDSTNINSSDSPEVWIVKSPITLIPSQSGLFEQFISGGKKISLSIPPGAISQTIKVTLSEELLIKNNSSLVPSETLLLRSAFYRIVAVDENNTPARNFSKPITVILPLSENLRDFSGLGVYRWDKDNSLWRLLRDAKIDSHDEVARFTTNHFSLFAIFKTNTNFIPDIMYSASATPSDSDNATDIPRAISFMQSAIPGASEESFPFFDVEITPTKLGISGVVIMFIGVVSLLAVFALVAFVWGGVALWHLRQRRKRLELDMKKRE